MEDKPWKNEGLQNKRGSPTKAKEVRTGESVEIVQGGEHGSRMRWLPPKSSPGLHKRYERTSRGVLGKDRAGWDMAATSLHDGVLLDTEECHE